MPIPPHIDWMVWRIVSSERFSVSLYEIENGWTLDQVLDAHDVLDMYHDAEVMSANQHYLESLHRSGGRRG